MLTWHEKHACFQLAKYFSKDKLLIVHVAKAFCKMDQASPAKLQWVAALLGLELVLWHNWVLSSAFNNSQWWSKHCYCFDPLHGIILVKNQNQVQANFVWRCQLTVKAGESMGLFLLCKLTALSNSCCWNERSLRQKVLPHSWMLLLKSQKTAVFFSCHRGGTKFTVLRLFLSLQDYFHQLICITEREKFIVPVRAIGARAILDFPDQVNFSECPVKFSTQKTLLVRNIGNRKACYSISTQR